MGGVIGALIAIGVMTAAPDPSPPAPERVVALLTIWPDTDTIQFANPVNDCRYTGISRWSTVDRAWHMTIDRQHCGILSSPIVGHIDLGTIPLDGPLLHSGDEVLLVRDR